jgi:hypothetical protein
MTTVCVIYNQEMHFFKMKILLTKETQQSFHLFDDIFQFFCLIGLPPEECQADPSNLAKFDWKGLDDLKPSDATTNTDMAADWKLIGVGGGVKQAKHFCTLCPLQPDDVHQSNEVLC